MTLDKHEMKLLLTAALIQLCIPGQPIKVAWLKGVFERDGKLQENIKKLRIGNLITFDPFAHELRVLPHPGLHILIEFQETPELFTQERPLDEVLAEVCKKPPEGVILHTAESFAPVPPKPPDPPPPEPDNPSRLCGTLQSLCGKSLQPALAENLRKTGALPAQILSLKEKHKGIKPLQNFESLSDAMALVESGDQAAAYLAMCGILGGVVMEGGDRDKYGQLRYGDGGKWRNRWLTNRRRTHSVLAELVSQIKETKVKSRGGKAEQLWQEFQCEVESKT